jgi:two-component system, sensor histidine kinase and response regulator
MDKQNLSESPAILIVDDNHHNLQVLGKLLQENKYQIQFATNGEAALEWLNKRLFDLILLDINMPVMNGFEVCLKIRSNQYLNNLPIIFLSADSDRESILKGFELGAQDYITKPFDSRELLSRVKTHLSLKESLEKLEQLNKTLENKVLERTAQLSYANEQLKALNLKLFDLDLAKSEFLHLISHEIRTPLNGIIGPVELLKESADTNEIAELIEILDTSVKRLEKFSLNALLITRLKTRQHEVHKESISLPGLINSILQEKSDNIKLKNLNVIFNNESSSSEITGEQELIKICLGNILDNAIIFSNQDGEIDISLLNDGNNLDCKFRDGGIGFNDTIKQQAFELFSLGDSRNDNSPGIGLPVAKMIMEAHNGVIEIGNNEAGGAFVRLRFNKNI